MCRNIRMLFNFAPPVTDDEIRAAALQYVRKVSGFAKPSKANEAAFARAVDDVASATASCSPRCRQRPRRATGRRKPPRRGRVRRIVTRHDEPRSAEGIAVTIAHNRSMPEFGVLPVLHYRDVRAAVTWLCRAFGARERLRMGDHRAQMLIGDGAFVVAAFHGTGSAGHDAPRHSMLVRIDNVDAHMKHASEFGARILARPTDFPYGERQYTAEDAGGHVWTFSQTIADVDPATWGGSLMP